MPRFVVPRLQRAFCIVAVGLVVEFDKGFSFDDKHNIIGSQIFVNQQVPFLGTIIEATENFVDLFRYMRVSWL